MSLLLFAGLMAICVHVLWAQQHPVKLAVPIDNGHQKHLLPPHIHDSADGMGWIINLQVDSAAGGHPRSFIAIIDSKVSTCHESGVVEGFRIKIGGRGKARVGEQLLVDPILIWPNSSGVAKWTALNNPGPLFQLTALRSDLHILKIAVYLSRELIKFSDSAFSHGA